MNEISLIKDLFDKKGDYEAALFCTFSLNLNFLENYLLKSNALAVCDSLSIFTDASTYNSFIDDKPRWLNKKYLVTRVPSKGVFHPKIYLIASTKKAILAIGSANLTREGMTSNLELLSLFEFSKEQTLNNNILQDVINYFKQLARISGNTIASEKVSEMEAICSGLFTDKEQQSVHLLHNLQVPILEGIKNYLGSSQPSEINVLSPFYDSKLEVINVLHEIYPQSLINILLQQGKSNFPKQNFDSLNDKVKLSAFTNIDRYMHGKTLLFKFSNRTVLYIGSANCTNVALLQNIETGNYEAGVIGEIDSNTEERVLQPLGIKPSALMAIEELAVADMEDITHLINDDGINFIQMAVKNNDDIIITINEKNRNKYTVLSVIAKNEQEQIVIEISPQPQEELKLSYSKHLRSIKEPFYITADVKDESGVTKTTNIYWVINLEVKKSDSKSKYRYVYSNPFELATYLYELTRLGNIEELTKFMQTFDIPFDLILPPHMFRNKNPWSSEGNIEGTLSHAHMLRNINSEGIEPYRYFLDRIHQKLIKHIENAQKEKISNYMYLLSLMYSLIEYLDIGIYDKYKDAPTITSENWREVRLYYNLLISYLNSTWTQTWEHNSYSEKINGILSDEIDDTFKNTPINFEQYLIDSGYIGVVQELIRIALTTIANFKSIQGGKMVDTGLNGLVVPRLFERDIHLLELDKTRDKFKNLEMKLENYKVNLEVVKS